MLKKITVVLLGVCVTSMTLTGVSAADFSDGMTEAAVEEDTFTDGSEGIKTESITAMVNDMAAHAQEKGQEYQKLKVQKEELPRSVQKRLQLWWKNPIVKWSRSAWQKEKPL